MERPNDALGPDEAGRLAGLLRQRQREEARPRSGLDPADDDGAAVGWRERSARFGRAG